MSVVNAALHTQVWINAVRPASLVPALKSKHFGSPTPELYKVWTTTSITVPKRNGLWSPSVEPGPTPKPKNPTCVFPFENGPPNCGRMYCPDVCRYSPTVSLQIGGRMAE